MRLVHGMIAVGFGLAAVACVPTGITGGGLLPASGSSLTSIDMNMPRLADLQGRNQEIDAAIQAQMLAYRLQVTPSDANCAQGTRVDQTGMFETTARIASSIRQGCDYSVVLEIGSAVAGVRTLDRVFFRNDPALSIGKNDIAGRPSLNVSLALRDVSASAPQVNVLPPGPGVVPQRPSLPPEKDVEVVDATGARVMLSTIFKGEYLLLDFSQPGCGACVSMARELASDEDFQWAFGAADAKCSHATVVPSGQRGSWLGMFPASGRVGSHSIFPEGGFSAVASKFGQSIRATPTFLLIDRNGNVIDSDAGNLPAKTFQVCSR